MLPGCIASKRLERIPIFSFIICDFILAIGASVQAARLDHQLPGPENTYFLTEQKPLSANVKASLFPDFLIALDVLQQDYYAIWQGVWPTSIDWTSAVLGTYFSAALTTLSASYSGLAFEKENENLINGYFSHLIGAYFGQDIFGIRQQAHDDMLWVVLEWLESIKFIQTHSSLHYTNPSFPEERSWYGAQYIPAFSHRARIFWELASQGWDTTLCDGGMLWNAYPPPYKNAITNELYITASISMYLYFPGDDNASPFSHPSNQGRPGKPHDPKYLAAAIDAYRWLQGVRMTNAQGLYADGFHISGWSSTNITGTDCDQRDEMVYTYNQGVLLSGLRGLYEATGSRSYLEDAHKLVKDVIRATGWNSMDDKAQELPNKTPLGKWHGLGRSGVLEDACDSSGSCSQDGQTFKGIFFHHLTLFCAHLPPYLSLPEGSFAGAGLEGDRKWHDESCLRYAPWIRHNAEAALTTRDQDGMFGMWWGAPKVADMDNFHPPADLPEGVIDHRNMGVPPERVETERYRREWRGGDRYLGSQDDRFGTLDLNDRGRGRTVESQGGGIAVLRAAWEISESDIDT